MGVQGSLQAPVSVEQSDGLAIVYTANYILVSCATFDHLNDSHRACMDPTESSVQSKTTAAVSH